MVVSHSLVGRSVRQNFKAEGWGWHNGVVKERTASGRFDAEKPAIRQKKKADLA